MRLGDAATGAQHLRSVSMTGGQARDIPLPGERGARIELHQSTAKGLLISQRQPSSPQLRLVSLVDPNTGGSTLICEP